MDQQAKQQAAQEKIIADTTAAKNANLGYFSGNLTPRSGGGAVVYTQGTQANPTGQIITSGGLVPNVNVANTPIAADLIGANQKPLNIPPTSTYNPTINPLTTALSGNAPMIPSGTTMVDGMATIAPVEDTGSSLKNDITSLLNFDATRGDATAKLQEEQQLAQKTQNATDTYNAYNQAKLLAEQKVQAIYADSTLTREQASQQVQELSRLENANLANLAVQANMAANNLTAAENIIKAKIDAQFSPIKDQIEYKMKLLQLNNDDLTESQKIKLTAQINKQENEQSLVQTSASLINQTLMENGAPASVFAAVDAVINEYASGKISAQTAQTKMFQATGQYGKDVSKTLSLEKQRLENEKLTNEISAKSGINVAGNPAVNALSVISAGLPQNQREAFTSSISTALGRNDEMAVDRVLRNAAKSFAGATLATEITKRDQAIDALGKLKTALVEYENSGKTTNVIKGGYEDIARKAGQTTDKDLAAIETKIRLAVQAYRSAVSGAAFSESEIKEYNSIFPNKKNSFELNSTIADTLLNSFENNNSSFYSSYYGDTPSNIAKKAIYENLVQNATPEQIKQLEQ